MTAHGRERTWAIAQWQSCMCREQRSKAGGSTDETNSGKTRTGMSRNWAMESCSFKLKATDVLRLYGTQAQLYRMPRLYDVPM